MPPETVYDAVILGGGPAGLSAAVYAARKMMKAVLVSGNVGGQVASYYDIENYLGFSMVGAADLVSRFERHVDKFGLEKAIGRRIVGAELDGPVKRLVNDDGRAFLTKTLIIATGKRPRPLGVPGEQEFMGRGVAVCSTCDAPLFAGADVAVVGGGNSALEAVVDLAKVARSVTLVARTSLSADPILIEKIKEYKNLTILPEHETLAVMGGKNGVTGLRVRQKGSDKARELAVEGVFVEIGLLPNSELFRGKIELNTAGEIVIDARCRTSVQGVFACGDVTDVPYKQVVIAVGEGAKAALAANEYLLMKQTH